MARAVAAAALLAAALAVGGAGAATPAPRNGGTVVVAWPGGPEPGCVAGCQPMSLMASPPVVQLILGSGPLLVTPTGWRPALVSRTTVTRTPPAVTLHLRPQARWSDARPMTAADIVLSYQTLLRNAPPPATQTLRDVIRRMVPLGPKTLRIELRSPNALWRQTIGDLGGLPSHVLTLDVTPVEVWRDRIVDPRSGRRIGGGPFLLERFEAGRQIVLTRSARYWGPRPARLDRLVLRLGLSDPVGALRRGEVDVVGGHGAAVQTALGELRRRPARGVTVAAVPGAAWEHLDLRVAGGHPALGSRLVRQAIAYGIDRPAIVRDLAARGMPALWVTDSTAFLPTERGYEANWRAYRYDVRRAQGLLEQAGCRRGADGYYACEGRRLSLQFSTTAGNPTRARTLELIRTQLRQVGIDVVPQYFPDVGVDVTPGFYPAGALSPFLRRGEFDAALFAWRKKGPGGAGNLPYRCGVPENYTGYCIRLVHRDLDQASRALQPARHIAIANAADRKLARDVPVIPLYQTVDLVGYRTSVRGIRPNPFGELTWNAEDWWRAP